MTNDEQRPFKLILKTRDSVIVRLLSSKEDTTFIRAMDSEPIKRKRGRPPKNASKAVSELASKPKRKRSTRDQNHEEVTANQAKGLNADKPTKKNAKQKENLERKTFGFKKKINKAATEIRESSKQSMKKTVQEPQVLIFNTDKKNVVRNEEKLSETKTEFYENNESSNDATMVKTEEVRSFKYHTTIPEQPTVLKKFRPPVSKYKLREMEALAAAEASAEMTENVATTSAASLRINLPSPLELDSYTSSDSFFSCSSEIQPSTPLLMLGIEVLNNNIAKFCQLNAWLARKQSRWCVKTKSSLNKMLYKESLISTFKCMSRNCSYTTMSMKNFAKHLAHHEAESEVDSLLFYCPYCFFKGDSSVLLMKHYDIHQNDKYACGYCFYRSAIDQSCWEHVKSHHSQYPLIVYQCPLETCLDTSSPSALERLHRKRLSFVRPLKCSCE